MSELISGKEALIALANGEEVQYVSSGMVDTKYWSDSEKTKNFTIHDFYSGSWVFRLKPRTITINGIEVPAPFKPRAGELAFYITAFGNYDSLAFDWQLNEFGYWRTEEEVRQVVAALRQVFGVKK